MRHQRLVSFDLVLRDGGYLEPGPVLCEPEHTVAHGHHRRRRRAGFLLCCSYGRIGGGGDEEEGQRAARGSVVAGRREVDVNAGDAEQRLPFETGGVVARPAEPRVLLRGENV